MNRLGNLTSMTIRITDRRKETAEPTDPSQSQIELAIMEIFIIVIAVIAVAAALILLVLLQLKIKRQNATEIPTTSQRNHVQRSQVEEIAVDYPNDLILKNGPPPYREVMKSPELYPVPPSTNVGGEDVKIQIPSSPIHNEHSKRTWNQLFNALLRSDDQGLNIPSGKYTPGNNTPISKDSYKHNSIPIDEVLPTYDDVTSEITREEPKITERFKKPLLRLESAGQYDFLGFHFGIEKTKLCRNNCVFTVSNALQTVIAEDKIQSLTRPRLATM